MIEIIHIESTKTERHIKTSQRCYGITHHHGVLLWCEKQRDIQMKKLSDDKVTTLVKQTKLLHLCYLKSCGDKIYKSNPVANTVTCYTIIGENLWEFEDASVLQDPFGVTLDSNCNVYVTSCASNTIVVLEPDGRKGRQLTSSGGELSCLSGIYFDNLKTVCWLPWTGFLV